MNPNNGVSDSENLRISQLGILLLSSTEWLVRDPSLPDGDPAALMGIIEQIGGACGVTKLGVLNTRWVYSSFDRAQASFLVPGAPEPPATFGPTEPVSSRVTV
ncbi:hypothetical protein E3T46_11335 [Cryobacterium sp. Hh11]|uniref:hypothetical protein n=1 Tax=Cryobacterium sp. Hh11 TaxID=2555868 RepID=UPI00106CC898|nr:hypothetical protein [Cryobacterium sp. Hh11]TFD49950.1 hypothetical protein E3T46_11335 [Cryobacterium sp. Hh11]